MGSECTLVRMYACTEKCNFNVLYSTVTFVRIPAHGSSKEIAASFPVALLLYNNGHVLCVCIRPPQLSLSLEHPSTV